MYLNRMKNTSLLRSFFSEFAVPKSKKRLRAQAKAGSRAKIAKERKRVTEKTAVTPAVYAIAKKIFQTRLLRVVELPQEAAEVRPVPDQHQHKDAIRKIEWVESEDNGEANADTYHSVLLDGTIYEVRSGDARVPAVVDASIAGGRHCHGGGRHGCE